MTLTSDGTVYISGTSLNGTEQVMSVAKVENTGRVAWIAQNKESGALANPFDVKLGLTSEGYPIAVGSYYRSGVGTKLVVARFDATSGHLDWARELNEGVLNKGGRYTINEVLVGPFGQFFMVGTYAVATGENVKPLVMRIDPTGKLLWASIDTTPSYTSYIMDAELDENQNLLFLVSSLLGRNDTEIYLAKYAQDGTKSWGNLIQSKDRLLYPKALALSKSGKVAVTGFSRGTLVGDVSILFTKLFSNTGDEIGADNLEDMQETSGDAVAFNGSSLFVAGHSFGAGSATEPLFVVKYKTGSKPSDNVEQLKRNWAISEPANVHPDKIVFDEQQNPIVTGKDFVISYNKMGERQWKFKPKGELAETAQAKNGNGQSISRDLYLLTNHLLGTNQSTVVVTKINTTGNQIWQYQHKQQHLNMTGISLAVNEKGEVYVVATIHNSSTESYVNVFKLNADGQESWQSSYEGNSTIKDLKAIDLKLNGQGGVYVVGNFKVNNANGSNLRHVFVANYEETNGNRVWNKIYPDHGSSAHQDPQELFILPDGSFYVVIQTQSCCISHPGISVIKINSEGEILWNVGVGDGSEMEMRDVAVGANGSIAITGSYYNPRAGINTSFVTKINNEGKEEWFKLADSFDGVLVMANGNVAATGSRASDLYLAVYNNQGSLAQSDTYGEAEGRLEIGKTMSIDASGNLYVGGIQVSNENKAGKLLLLKYGSPGDQPCYIPVSVKLYLPPMAKRVGWQVRTTADFGNYIVAGKTGVRWTWGDDSRPTISYTADGTSRITGEHTYNKANIYTIGLNFEESCLKAVNGNYSQQMVIFDPEAGSVMGRGELNKDTDKDKKISFKFSVRYAQKFSHHPVGNFHANLGELGNLVSKSLDWMVINGNRAAIQGSGKIDGKGNYRFLATMSDADRADATDKNDGIQIQVWNLDKGNKLIFSSSPSGQEKLDLAQMLTPIKKGQIIINGTNRTQKINLAIEDIKKDQPKAIPNPFSNTTVVNFKVPEGESYQAKLYNAKGKMIKDIQSGVVSPSGHVEVLIDGANLEEGIYLLKLQTSKYVRSSKLLLNR